MAKEQLQIATLLRPASAGLRTGRRKRRQRFGGAAAAPNFQPPRQFSRKSVIILSPKHHQLRHLGLARKTRHPILASYCTASSFKAQFKPQALRNVGISRKFFVWSRLLASLLRRIICRHGSSHSQWFRSARAIFWSRSTF